MESLLESLHRAEAELPALLRNHEGWQGVDVLYHEPRVERVWRQWGEMRISLHVIHPARREDCLFHPHPWPSAMRVVHGGYEMGIGYGTGTEAPEEACRVVLAPGSEYCMENPDGWHYVCPAHGSINLSVMVSGRPWAREMPVEPEHGANPPLTGERMGEILREFAGHYPA